MIYLLLGIVGALFPLSPAIHFMVTHQFAVGQFAQQAIASTASLTAWLDVIISALAVIVWVYVEGKRLGMEKLWTYSCATVLVGPSCGLPLFLYRRSLRLKATKNALTNP
ncbi:MAG: DUF2834 domain-containing protein [Cyanobacteria bacterium P01_F01_bin.86]